MSESAHLVPAEIRIEPSDIPIYRAARHPTSFQGCTQVNQIFLKADGKITCSCVRYYHILEEAKNINVAEWYNGEIMTYIRDSFKEGYEPFSFCKGCIARKSVVDVDEASRLVELHIEPSNQCNLFCAVCTCTDERRSANPPARVNVDFALFEKMLNEFVEGGLTVAQISFVGFGEPLFNSELPKMARLSREAFPNSRILVDTNANFGWKRAAELADCGISEIRLALDGTSQVPYETYRASGNFQKAFSFAATLAKEVKARGSKTQLTWKYILFRHNDSDAEILKAVEMAKEIGLALRFDLTAGDLASKRDLSEIDALVRGTVEFGSNMDLRAAEDDPPALLDKVSSADEAVGIPPKRPGILEKLRNTLGHLARMKKTDGDHLRG